MNLSEREAFIVTDVHSLLREAEAQKQARAEQLPTEQDCIRMMVQCRLRLIDLGWQSGEYAPRDNRRFIGVNPGFAGPAEYQNLFGNAPPSYFVAEGRDWWPVPRPLVWKEKQ